jgi:hypothetical protein
MSENLWEMPTIIFDSNDGRLKLMWEAACVPEARFRRILKARWPGSVVCGMPWV